MTSLSFYYKISISKAVEFYPNFGLLLGYEHDSGAYPFSAFEYGARLGFDMLFKISPNFYFTISPDIPFLQDSNPNVIVGGSGFDLNIGFNF